MSSVPAVQRLGEMVDGSAAPHPYPLPVKDGERGAPAVRQVPSPRTIRGEGAGRRMRGGAVVCGRCY
ncbi:MAG: hypothetical protein E5V62_21260 [Mesorhizobium sp.]|nr:hypothetical protein EN751_11605 [Mesorhizobium sp. M4A.F.Ca.ET.029.04.2.1]TIW33292.1 MAG: hypothetical protein E5V62_21260 [Mesorhizobium sp.]